MYDSHADLYDAMYSWKDYAHETMLVRAILDEHGVPRGGTVLEAACGTGAYAYELSADYLVSGYDLSPEMVTLAQQKHLEAVVGDLRDYIAPEPVDAVVCLFSGIGYLLTRDEVRQALRCFHSSLKPGGVLILEPWLRPEVFQDGGHHQQVVDLPAIKICRQSVGRLRGEISEIGFDWLVLREDSKQSEHFHEVHQMLMLPHPELRQMVVEAGFVLDHPGVELARPLIVGQSQISPSAKI